MADDQHDVEESRKRMATPPPSSSASVSSKSSKRKKQSPGGSSDKTSASRGLRHFSVMVCKKVEEKGTTTYNEVADELVTKVVEERRKEDPDGKFDEKNIRRRVYDALNVLMAMEIITKDKKEITWRGLPSNRPGMDELEQERDFRENQLETKREALRELLAQQVCFRNLVEHNSTREDVEEKIPLPFIIVNTHNSAVIQCEMSEDRTDVMFDFSMPFEINDDNTILKRMGMDKAPDSVLKQMLPEDLMAYCKEHNLLENIESREGAVPVTPSDETTQKKPAASAEAPRRGNPPTESSHQDHQHHPRPPSYHPHHHPGYMAHPYPPMHYRG